MVQYEWVLHIFIFHLYCLYLCAYVQYKPCRTRFDRCPPTVHCNTECNTQTSRSQPSGTPLDERFRETARTHTGVHPHGKIRCGGTWRRHVTDAYPTKLVPVTEAVTVGPVDIASAVQIPCPKGIARRIQAVLRRHNRTRHRVVSRGFLFRLASLGGRAAVAGPRATVVVNRSGRVLRQYTARIGCQWCRGRSHAAFPSSPSSRHLRLFPAIHAGFARWLGFRAFCFYQLPKGALAVHSLEGLCTKG